MSKHKYKINQSTICIKLPIETDEYLRKFILDNAFMRNRIRNDFAEEANKYKGKWNYYKDFKLSNFYTYYFNTVENPDRRYDHYCVGLSHRVYNDFRISLKSIRTNNSKVMKNAKKNNISLCKIKLNEFHYKKFDFNMYSFRVDLSHGKNNGKFYTRLDILDNNHIRFRVRGSKYGRPKEYLNISLKEPLFDHQIDSKYMRYYTSNGYINECTFDIQDIKQISFMYECGHHYIQLFINATYNINNKSLKCSKDRICGIDTGIRHPITIYDGKNTMYIKMDDKTTRKIHYLERRIGRLQRVLYMKYNYNIAHKLPMCSNNTIKVLLKINKLYRKITNIKNFWIQNTCKKIVTTYSKICVDRFEQPNHVYDKDFKELPIKAKRTINYANRFHSMYYFNEFLKHDCIKYGCEYVESPEDTTRTCSICGHKNKHLSLRDTHLVCNKCGNVIERDMNAAMNCYDYLLSNS